MVKSDSPEGPWASEEQEMDTRKVVDRLILPVLPSWYVFETTVVCEFFVYAQHCTRIRNENACDRIFVQYFFDDT